ncbi:MAG TPA: TIR domain-containing protein [Candidatus Methanomethylophilaceae archaeon]|nr:TIR domain-containing protein [Candidatus Methanomethylophilaceae archaeon]
MYNIFISHSWAYSDGYEKLVKLLNNKPNFEYRDYSVPFNNPVNSSSDRELKKAIVDKISPTSCVIILAGVYATYSKWINIEIDIAKNHFENPKKIIAVEPYGSERTSTVVKDAADYVVKWNTDSIVKAIRS